MDDYIGLKNRVFIVRRELAHDRITLVSEFTEYREGFSTANTVCEISLAASKNCTTFSLGDSGRAKSLKLFQLTKFVAVFFCWFCK